MKIDPQAGKQMLQTLLQPWFTAVDNPPKAQEESAASPLTRLCPNPIRP